MASELTVQTLRGPTSGANANTILIPSGQLLDASAGFVAPAGHMIQIQYNRRQADLSTSGTAWTNCAEIVFTPKYSNSLLELAMDYNAGRAANQTMQWRFYDVTQNLLLSATGLQLSSGVYADGDVTRHTFLHYHAPASTASRTYRLEGRNSTGSGTVWFHTYGNITSSFFVIREIAG
jgi:hypothetical protein